MHLIPKLVCVLLSLTPSAAATTFGCPTCTSCSSDSVLANREDTWSRTTPCSSGYVATLTTADLVVTDSTMVTVIVFDSITQQSYSYESIRCFNLNDIPQINPINNIKVQCNNNAETCDIKINFIMTCKAPSTTPSAPAPAPTSGIFKDGLQSYYARTSLSTNCRDPSDCAYRCSTGYGMAVGGSYFYASASARPDGCSSCYDLEGTVGGTNRDTVTGTSPYGFKIKAAGTTADTLAVEYTPVQGITCQATYSKAQSAPTNPFRSASYVRSSISAACDVPDACDYKCSLGYTLTAVGADKVVATPVNKQPAPDCSCATLTAYVDLDTGKAVGYDATVDTSYSFALSGSTIQLEMNVKGMTCSATFSEGTYSSNNAVNSGSAISDVVMMPVIALVAATLLAQVLQWA